MSQKNITSVTRFVLIYFSCVALSLQTRKTSDDVKTEGITQADCFKRCYSRNPALRVSALQVVKFITLAGKRVKKSLRNKIQIDEVPGLPCYQDCTKRSNSVVRGADHQRRRRGIVTSSASHTGCGTEYPGKYVGEVSNLSVKFRIDDNSTWLANVTWSVDYNSSSSYEDDRWSGFVIKWNSVSDSSRGTPTASVVSCHYSYKNTTSMVIQSGGGKWTYPQVLGVLVETYPYHYDSPQGPTFKRFDPKANWTTTASSVPSESPTLSTTATPTSTTKSKNSSETTRNDAEARYWSVAPDSSVQTSPDPFLGITIAIVLGTTVGCFLVALLVKHLHTRYKKRHARVDNAERTYEYDASIIYSSNDTEFVRETLLPTLENEPFNLHCLIHYRDWEIGKFISENIADTIYKPRYVIAVISRNFLESNFCKVELQMALERLIRQRDSCLKVINLDGVKTEELPKALRYRTFLDMSQREERTTWRHRLGRQISREEATVNLNNQNTGEEDRVVHNSASDESTGSRESVV